MTFHEWLDIGMTLGTLALAFFTWRLARATVHLAKDTKEASQRQIEASRKIASDQIQAWQKHTLQQIGVQTWLALEARFDSKEMKKERQNLAFQMPYDPVRHHRMSDAVFDFFESVGTAYNQGYLDQKLAVSSFSYHAFLWWEAGKPYVDEERRILGGDDSIYEEFEKFARAMAENNEKIDKPAMAAFLAGEQSLIDIHKSSDARVTINMP
jgi:hypothetical protein